MDSQAGEDSRDVRDEELGTMDVNTFMNHPEVHELQSSNTIDLYLLLYALGILPSQSAAGNTGLNPDKAWADLCALGEGCAPLDLVHTLVLHLLSALPHRLSRVWLGRDCFTVEPTPKLMEGLASMVGEREWAFITESRGGNLNICWIETVMLTKDALNRPRVLDVFPVRKRTYIARDLRGEDARMYWLNVGSFHLNLLSQFINLL